MLAPICPGRSGRYPGSPWCLALLLAFTILSSAAGAKPPQVSLADGPVVRSWGTAAGLPQNTVNAIVETKDGYLWLGTREGLARFDGVRFVSFGVGEGLGSLVVQTLYQDRQGTLWIGTDGGGLSRWTGSAIEPVPLANLPNVGESVNVMTEDAEGRLWVGTRAGIRVYANRRFESDQQLASLNNSSIYALLPDRRGTMWISTAGNGLFQYANGTLTACPGPAEVPRITAYCLLEDREGNIWASVGNGQLLSRSPAGAWKVYTQAEGVPFAYVTSMALGQDGTLWAGSLDEGLFYLKGERFHRLVQPLPGNAIRAIYAGREGNLWIGTRASGLISLHDRTLLHVGAAQGLTNDFTRSVAETPDGLLWVGTIGGGIYRGTLDSMHPYGEGPYRFYAAVESVLATRDEEVWWGGARALLRWKDGELLACYTNMSWLDTASVTALCADVRDGIWIGTSLGSLAYHNTNGFALMPGRVGKGPIIALAQERDRSLWVGSVAGGLVRVNPGNGAVVSVTNEHLKVIRTLLLEKDGTLWIGTAGNGLARWRNGQVHTFTVLQGLGANTVSQIIDDGKGALWLGCSRGIIRVQKSDLEALATGRISFLHPRVFGINDGMAAEECSNGFFPAGLKTSSGLLCFSTVQGLVLVDPEAQERVAPPPRVVIEEVLVGGKVLGVVPEEGFELLGIDGEQSRFCRIPAGGYDVEIHYTGLSFSAPERVRFRYQMDGIDRTWVEAGQRRTAYYQRIPPGNYVFRVKACNADGLWSEHVATMAVAMDPYFYETNWFLAGAALAVLGGLGGMLRVVERRRFRRRLARLQTQHAIEKERLRISQDMHDHLGAMLTQVSQLSDMGGGEAADNTPAQQRFERIGSQARGAVQALDEIIWATNPKNDNLPSFAEYVSRFADEFLESTAIRCWQEVPHTLPNQPLRADVRHNVFLAVREAFNNAVRHSAATEIWLRLTLQGLQVTLEVEDNGRGFNPHGIAGGGNGLANMRSRMAGQYGRFELDSAPGKGTRVRFIFPLEEGAPEG